MSVSFDSIEERNKFIEQNMKLVSHVLKHYIYIGMDEYEDLFQEGCIGLIMSADRFDDSCGIKFSTYAIPNIIGYIKKYKLNRGMQLHGLKVTRSIKEDRIKIDEFINKHPDCSIQDIIKGVGITYERYGIINALNVESMNRAIDTHKNKENTALEISETIGDIETGYDEIEAELVTTEILRELKRKLDSPVYDMAEEIIYAYLIGGEKINQEELAVKYKISQAQVSRRIKQIRKVAIDIMEKLYN